jgi:hypothetical protein
VVAVVRALVVAVALVALASLPCAMAVFITSADEHVERAVRAVRRGLRRFRCAIARRRGFRWLAPPVPMTPDGPPIERVAADLRRLDKQRLGVATRSTVWFTAVQRAYDDRLRLACRSLGIEEHLDGLAGVDLEIERVRIEGELLAAGMALRGANVDRRQDQR